MAALLHTSHDGEAAMNRIAQLTSTGADIDTGPQVPPTCAVPDSGRPGLNSLLFDCSSQSSLVAV